MIELEQFRVGESYKGWVFREHPNDVFFTRPSDHSLQAIWRLLAIIAVLLAYMLLRIVIGGKRRSRNQQAAPSSTAKRSAKR